MRDCITRVTQLLAGGAEGAVQRAMRNSFLISAGERAHWAVLFWSMLLGQYRERRAPRSVQLESPLKGMGAPWSALLSVRDCTPCCLRPF